MASPAALTSSWFGPRAAERTAQDIARAESLPALIAGLVKKAATGDAESKEDAAASLKNLAQQNQCEAMAKAGAIQPLVGLLKTGTSKAQAAAAGALHHLLKSNAENQQVMVEAGGVGPTVKLLTSGGAKVQEEAASALASIGTEVSYQASIVKAGAVPPLVAMLKNGSTAAQAFASQALANAANHAGEVSQNLITRLGAVPHLLTLLGNPDPKAQTPAAGAIAKLAEGNRSVQAEIASAGGIPRILPLLNGRNTEAQVHMDMCMRGHVHAGTCACGDMCTWGHVDMDMCMGHVHVDMCMHGDGRGPGVMAEAHAMHVACTMRMHAW